jgi:hypothetical protein
VTAADEVLGQPIPLPRFKLERRRAQEQFHRRPPDAFQSINCLSRGRMMSLVDNNDVPSLTTKRRKPTSLREALGASWLSN